MIGVAIVDDHHAVRLGLHTAVESEPGLVPVGAAANAAGRAPLLYRTQADVVLLDDNLPDVDGLTVCRDLESEALAPRAILYPAFADGSMTVLDRATLARRIGRMLGRLTDFVRPAAARPRSEMRTST